MSSSVHQVQSQAQRWLWWKWSQFSWTEAMCATALFPSEWMECLPLSIHAFTTYRGNSSERVPAWCSPCRVMRKAMYTFSEIAFLCMFRCTNEHFRRILSVVNTEEKNSVIHLNIQKIWAVLYFSNAALVDLLKTECFVRLQPAFMHTGQRL